MSYSMQFHVEGKRCVILGGGRVAERKALKLAAAGAEVVVLSPDVTDEIRRRSEAGDFIWQKKRYEKGCLSGAALVFLTADLREEAETAREEAHAAGALVNDAVHPEASDFDVPACVTRGDLELDVSTNGASPELARQIRMELEAQYPPAFGEFLVFLQEKRKAVREHILDGVTRQDFWRKAVDAETLRLLHEGDLAQAKERVNHAAASLGL
ncbi:MAG: bifunctional precorrin-2 dehydrogenase/sirohydrochlorin ferrochelatase [Selenomonadaceae bacterium]|nr:bifunctional precorrin-2 dehydrogenase/sirohydrochlorin ferrochelatase [Selenomonadaceae bacterium]MDY2684980.1 bifunctional precorrin-2 dehydrogenase/sirohydrochlorin ferrochelatase [Selenomonadaceae bacterium]